MLACVFSERTRVERGPNQLMARAALRRAEAKLLDLTVSNPTTVGLGSGTDLLAPKSPRPTIGSMAIGRARSI